MSLEIITTFFEENIFLSLILTTFLSQIGIPFGAIFLIMFAGSITENYFNLFYLIIIISISTILGDIIAYKIGRKYGKILLEKYKNKKIIYLNYKKSAKIMKKYGSVTIFFTRFLITGLGPMTNYVAGLDKFNFKKFLIYIISGEIIYSTIFITLGFIFKETWEEVLTIINNFSFLIIFIILLILIFKKILKLIKEK